MSTVPPALSTASSSDEPSFFIDWPTLFLAIGVYARFAIVTLHYHTMPWWLVLPLGATIVCLHGSLQHEATHGFPTRWEAVNSFIVGWPLWLWLPYLSYRWTHRTHHIDENLTNPELDPGIQLPDRRADRRHVAAAPAGAQHDALARRPHGCSARPTTASSPGRTSAGGARSALARIEAAALAPARPWPPSSIGCWRCARSRSGPTVAFFAYPGTALTLVRSYAEHRAAGPVQQRTVICESNFFWSWLFLYNNLHLIHHRHPRLAWHQRPVKYQAEKAQLTPEHGYYRPQRLRRSVRQVVHAPQGTDGASRWSCAPRTSGRRGQAPTSRRSQ
jgi:fatty acid desaturase